MAADPQITLRLTIADPLPGLAYSLQDKQSTPVGAVVADGSALSFDVPVRVAAGPRFLGPFVRSEGPERRFIYIATGGQAGGAPGPWSRRAKIDIHTLPAALLERALAGAVLELRLPGKAKDGGPSAASVKPLGDWAVV